MIRRCIRRLALLPVRVYQLAVSPWLPKQCRYLPTCSDYAIQAVERHGVVKGGGLATRRICRCHPWGGHGFDPVPGSDAPADTTESHDATGSGDGR